MRFVRLGTVFVIFTTWLSIVPAVPAAMDTNEFYTRFVELLGKSDFVMLERFVGANSDSAAECLRIVQERSERETDPERTKALQMLARELTELLAVTSGKKDCSMADGIYQRATQTAPLEESTEIVRRAIKLCPDHDEALWRWADLNRRLGKFDEAVKGYEKIFSLKRDRPEALLGIAETFSAAGLYQRSVPYLEKYLQKEPESKKANHLLTETQHQIDLDKDRIISHKEVVDRLRGSEESRLMCMCPYHVRLVARVRLRAVTFSTDSHRINSRARQQLAELAQALQASPLKDGHYLIEGHADNIGTSDFNQRLSLVRGEAVKRYLTDTLGVSPWLLSVAGMGESRPWASNLTRQGRQGNRRIEVLRLGQRDK